MNRANLACTMSAVLTILAVSAGRCGAAEFRVALQTVRFTEDSFDKSNFDQLSLASARKRCDESLRVLVQLIDDATELSDQQRDELLLAGEIDIHRFFYSYDRSKQGLKFGNIARDEWQAQFVKAAQKLGPLKQRYVEGLHGRSSLLDKSLATVLDADQYERASEMLSRRARGRYERYIEAALAIIDRKVPLSVDQRTTITGLLLDKTEPPRSFGTSTMPILLVLARMDEIEDDMRGLFTAAEFVVIRRVIDFGKASARGAAVGLR